MIKVVLHVEFDEETVKAMFQDAEVRFSKKKMKDLQQIINNEETLVGEPAEEAVSEAIMEIITDQWGE
jgi:hypothetical protein